MSDEAIEEEEQIIREQIIEETELAATLLKRPIRDLPTLDAAITCERSTPVRQAIEMMQQQRTACVLIVDQDRLIGVFTERDALNKVLAHDVDLDGTPVSRFMTSNPDCLGIDDELVFALNNMSVRGYRNVPLIDDQDRPVGVVSMRDIVDYLVSLFPEDILNLPPSPDDEFPDHRDGA